MQLSVQATVQTDPLQHLEYLLVRVEGEAIVREAAVEVAFVRTATRSC